MELEVLVPFAATRHQVFGAQQHPLVQLRHFTPRHRIARGIEIRQVAQHIAERVAQLAIRIHQARQNRRRHAHVFVELHRRRPQPQNLRAVILDDGLRLDRVAQRLVHRLAFAIQHPAVQQALPIRRTPPQARAHQQRTVEPAAILIATFQIHVGRPRQAKAIVEHRQVAGSRIEPHIQNVGLLGEFRAAAFGARVPRRQQLRRAPLVPDIRRVLGKERDDSVQNLAVRHRFAAALAVEHDDRHAPDALPRDAPVGAHRDHVGDALLPPLRHPLHVLDGFQRVLAEMIHLHADEPLLGGAEDYRVVAAPAVRVGVRQFLRAEQRAGLL